MKIIKIAVPVAFVVIVAAMLGLQLYWGNQHTTIPGELYRSAQPTPKDIAHYKKHYGIQSIINLRGANPGADWYDAEAKAAKEQGVPLIDFRMKAAHELTADEAKALIALMRDAPKPLLIHCRSGADRTGLAAALYVAAISKGGEEAAEYQLSIRYGHLPQIPFWWTDAQAMSRTFERLEPALGFHDS